MLMPKRTKFRKMHKGRNRGLASRGTTISFGDYGLMACGAGWITSRQKFAIFFWLPRFSIDSVRPCTTRCKRRIRP